MNKYIIKNCPNCLTYNRPKAICGLTYKTSGFKGETTSYKHCQNCTGCVMKQIVELCKEQKVINCNIDGKEQVLKAYYHTHLGDKILELLDIQEVE